MVFETTSSLGFPPKPQFESIGSSSTLESLVARIVSDVVVFVGLEEVLGAHVVAGTQHSLNRLIVCLLRFEGTLCLTSNAEHWSITPISLCGFQVTESALSTP